MPPYKLHNADIRGFRYTKSRKAYNIGYQHGRRRDTKLNSESYYYKPWEYSAYSKGYKKGRKKPKVTTEESGYLSPIFN